MTADPETVARAADQAWDVVMDALIYAFRHPDERGGGIIGKTSIVVDRLAAAGLLASPLSPATAALIEAAKAWRATEYWDGRIADVRLIAAVDAFLAERDR